MHDISDRLKILGESLSVRKFAERLDIAPTTLQEYLKGRMPPADFIVRVCERIPGIDPWWLMTGQGKAPEKRPDPRSAAVAANFEALNEDDKKAVEQIAATLAECQKITKKAA